MHDGFIACIICFFIETYNADLKSPRTYSIERICILQLFIKAYQIQEREKNAGLLTS